MSNVKTRPEHEPGLTKVEDLVALLGRPHMMGLLYAVGEIIPPPARFKAIQAELKVSPTTLTERLKEAVDAGLLSRESYDENPPRVEYVVTPNMVNLVPALMQLHDWCRDHALAPFNAA